VKSLGFSPYVFLLIGISASVLTKSTLAVEPENPTVIFDTDLALPAMPSGDGKGTPVCIDETSGLLVVGCALLERITYLEDRLQHSDLDVDGYSPFEGDCNDADPLINQDAIEICNELDDDCDGEIDESFLKCGDPLHCPAAEVCNGEDDDCDGQIDEGDVCGGCVPSPEICDGCDNDCDGIVDNPPDGGFPGPCAPPQPAPPGTCI
jgi:hypothetical protein